MSEPLDRVLTLLQGVRQQGGGYEALCPAHEDRNPSLSIGLGEDGRVLLFCQAGCETGRVLEALGLVASDLFSARGSASSQKRRIVAAYDYRRGDELLYQVVRFEPKSFVQRRPNGRNGWIWNLKGVQRVPYRLPELEAADLSAVVFIPEGEKDVERLVKLGLVATCNPGGAGKWLHEYREHFRGRRVAILPDNDQAGRGHTQDIGHSLAGLVASMKVVELPGLPPKGDVSHWLDAGGTREQLLTLVDAAAEWTPVELLGSSSATAAGDDDDASEGRRPRGLITMATLKTLYSGRMEWLVEGYVALRELTELVGGPEATKSWATADLARAVAIGGRWLGTFPVPQGTVIYVEQERANNLVYQVKLLEAAYGCSLDELLVLPPGTFNLRDLDPQARLLDAVGRYRPLLIVVNSFRSVFRGRAADGVEVADQVGWLGQLAEEYACAALMIDQTNKAGGAGRLRGMDAHADSLQKEYEADAVLHIERDRDEVGRGAGPARLYVGKRRAGESGPPFSYELRELGSGVAPIWLGETSVERTGSAVPVESATDRVVGVLRSSPEMHFSAQQISTITGYGLGTVKNCLSYLKGSGSAENTDRGRWRWAGSSSSSSSSSLSL